LNKSNIYKNQIDRFDEKRNVYEKPKKTKVLDDRYEEELQRKSDDLKSCERSAGSRTIPQSYFPYSWFKTGKR